MSEVVQDPIVSLRYQTTMQFVNESSHTPLWLGVLYLVANLTLNFLNFYWFVKMIQAVQKRFKPSKKEEAEEKPTLDGAAKTTGTDQKVAWTARARKGSVSSGEYVKHPPPGI